MNAYSNTSHDKEGLASIPDGRRSVFVELLRERGAWMPTVGASVAAMLAGWVIDDMLRPYLGLGLTLMLSLVVSTAVFFFARKWLRELRH